jgi:hypothetical protein
VKQRGKCHGHTLQSRWAFGRINAWINRNDGLDRPCRIRSDKAALELTFRVSPKTPRQSGAKLSPRDEARRIAADIAKLPELLSEKSVR